MKKVGKNNFKMAALAVAVLLAGLGRASYAAPPDHAVNKQSAAINNGKAAATAKNQQPGATRTTKLQAQTTINQVPNNWEPGAKAAADRYEALEHGHPLPGTGQMQLIMHGYVPPGMPPQQASLLYNSLPNNLKTPHVPQPGTAEWVSRMAGEPADPAAGLPIGATKEGIAAQNQKILEESVRERFGPIYIPPLHRDHNRAAQPSGNAIPQDSYTKDYIGSVREMTDPSGNIVAEYSYDPYGRQTQIAGSGPQSDVGYNSTYVHQRSGFLMMGARLYNPATGRFLNRDPIEEAGGTNLFAYAGNDPINRFDPTGEQPVNYGNWGGQGRVNGGPGSETSNFPNIGQPGFVKPTTPRDRCYYWHDVCLHNCARIGSSNPKDPKQPQYACDRQRCRKQCDTDLARCLGNVLNTYGNEGFPPTLQQEVGGFSGVNPFPGYTGSPNDNPGAFVPGLQPYNPNADPGYQHL